ncbi:hypothetical protein D3C78_1559900 [compost metagenome]
MGQRPDGDLLDQIVFGHPASDLGLQGRILIVQTIPGLLGLQLGAYPRLDDDGLDGLGDVVGGPEGQALLFALRIGEGGEQYHWDAVGVGVGAKLLEYLVAVHAGHHHIQQNEIGFRLATGDAQALLPALGGEYPVTG